MRLACSASAAPDDDAHRADGSMGSSGQSWSKLSNSISLSSVRLTLNI